MLIFIEESIKSNVIINLKSQKSKIYNFRFKIYNFHD